MRLPLIALDLVESKRPMMERGCPRYFLAHIIEGIIDEPL